MDYKALHVSEFLLLKLEEFKKVLLTDLPIPYYSFSALNN